MTEEKKTQHRAKIDADGNLIGFYPSDVYPVAPEGIVELTDAQYIEWRDAKCVLPHKNYRWQNGEMVLFTPPAPVEE